MKTVLFFINLTIFFTNVCLCFLWCSTGMASSTTGMRGIGSQRINIVNDREWRSLVLYEFRGGRISGINYSGMPERNAELRKSAKA